MGQSSGFKKSKVLPEIGISYDVENLGNTNMGVRHLNTGGQEFSIKVMRPGTKNPVWGLVVLTKEEVRQLIRHMESNK